MIVRVKLFAAARDAAGAGELEIEVRDGATLGDVERALLKVAPALAAIVPHARWAVNTEFAASNAMVSEASEIALIPPVSGG